MKKKEVLIIFVLAVLVAGLSWFYFIYRKGSLLPRLISKQQFGNMTNEKGTSLSFIRIEFPEQKLSNDYTLSTEVWWNDGPLSENDIGIEPNYGEFMKNPRRVSDFNTNLYKFWIILTNRKTYEKIKSLDSFGVRKIELASKEAFESDMLKKAQMTVLHYASIDLSLENWSGYRFRPNGICCFNRDKPEENYKKFLSRLKYQITQPNSAYSGPASSLREEDVNRLSSEGFFLINRFSPPKGLDDDNEEILFWTKMSIDYNANGILEDEHFISYYSIYKTRCIGMGHYFEDPAESLGSIDCDYLGAANFYGFPYGFSE